MKEVLMGIVTTSYFWIAVELLVMALLIFLIRKNSKRKKTIKEDMEYNMRVSQFRELDEMLINKKRGNR